MFEHFVVSDAELEKTNYENPLRFGSARYIAQFTEEQVRNGIIELNGTNNLNVRKMLNDVEKKTQSTTLHEFLSLGNVYPVVALEKLKIDDNSGEYTQEAYFDRFLTDRDDNNFAPPSVQKDFSCVGLHAEVEEALKKTFKQPKEKLIGQFPVVYEKEEVDVRRAEIDVGDCMSAAIIDTVFFMGGESATRFKLIRICPGGNASNASDRLIPIKGFLVLNEESYHYNYSDTSTEIRGGDASRNVKTSGKTGKHSKKSKKSKKSKTSNSSVSHENACKSVVVRTVEVTADYGEIGNEVKKVNFEKNNTYFKLASSEDGSYPNMSLEDFVESVVPTESVSSYVQALGATSFDTSKYEGKNEGCSTLPIVDCGRADNSAATTDAGERTTKGVVHDAEGAEKVKRVHHPRPVKINENSPSLPDQMFLTHKEFSGKEVQKMFDKWHKSHSGDSNKVVSTEKPLDEKFVRHVRTFFSRTHEVKYKSELEDQKAAILGDREIVNEAHAREDFQRVFQTSTREQDRKKKMAIGQFKSFRDTDKLFDQLTNLSDKAAAEVVERIPTLIDSIGFQALQPRNARYMYQTFVDVCVQYPKRMIESIILILIPIYIVYSQIENKPFITKVGFEEFYEHESWPLWKEEEDPRMRDKSAVSYVVQVMASDGDRLLKGMAMKVEDMFALITSGIEMIAFKGKPTPYLKNEVSRKRKEYEQMAKSYYVDGDQTGDQTGDQSDDQTDVNDLELGDQPGRQRFVNSSKSKLVSITLHATVPAQTETGPTRQTPVEEGTMNLEQVIRKVLEENEVSHKLNDEDIGDAFTKILNDDALSDSSDLVDGFTKLWNDEPDFARDIRFIESNFHRDLFDKKTRVRGLESIETLKKYVFRSETLLSLNVDTEKKRKAKLFCVALQTVQMLNETETSDERDRYLKMVSENLE